MVSPGDTLSEIALRYHVSVKALRQWNGLRSDKIIKGQYLKIWTHPPKSYVVRSGDTLSEIAIQFGLPVPLLRQLNDISNDRIYPGQRLRLRDSREKRDGLETHMVREGDTLWRIARQYGVDVPDLRELNDLKNDVITPGTILRITDSSEEDSFTAEDFEYVVKKGDRLWTIAQRFDVGVGLLRQLNHLRGNRIYPGQRLQLRPSSLDEPVHMVRPGETLSSIAYKYNVKVADLVELNDIDGEKILAGQKLRLKVTPAATHIVERGDALWEIARAYGIGVKELKRLNGLTSDRIYPGQELKLSGSQSEHLETYTVKKGDYLAGIARLHQMSVAELKGLNNLGGSVIHPGDKLKVKPLLSRSREWPIVSEINWGELMISLDGIRKIHADNGPYYYSKPRAVRQNNARYFEGPLQSPLRAYKQARKLWHAFEQEVTKLGRLSDTLEGWHFVLDPGHGGLDPGAVVKAMDGNGDRIYVVEDEYVYDIALRVCVLLRLHGAEVTMTLLSPNHVIRQSNPPTQTFVNEKNEVYNSDKLNRRNRWRNWPSGGQDGNLSSRVSIAHDVFRKVAKKRSIFLSFHADIDPDSPEAPLVLYYRSRKGHREDLSSREFARALLPALGAGAYARGQNLAVLRNNPAGIKVLLELRNLAYTDHVWALRFEELRHRDAEKVVKGILDYVRQQKRKPTPSQQGS